MSIELVILSNHLILCCLLLLLPSIFPSIRVFSNELTLHMRWPKYWSFSFSISPFHEYSGFISFRIDGLISLLSKGLTRVFSSTPIQDEWIKKMCVHIYICVCVYIYIYIYNNRIVFYCIRTGKGQFSFQSQRKAVPKNAQTTAQLHSSHTLAK